jgi:hypothetical protein
MGIRGALVGAGLALVVGVGGFAVAMAAHPQEAPVVSPVVVVVPVPSPSPTYRVDLIPPAMPNVGA